MAKSKPEYSHFGECLKSLRLEAKLTTAQAAQAAGVQEKEWLLWENDLNYNNPRLKTLWKIAVVLGVRPIDLLQ